MKAIACLIGALAASSAFAQQADKDSVDAKLRELCRTVLCRAPAPIRLKLADGTFFEVTPPSPTPIVYEDLITVYPGETVKVEARVEAGHLVDLVAVSEVRAPERTLIFTLRQEPSIGDGSGMMLKVESPFAGVLKYQLGMMLPSGNELLKTSSCPLDGGKPVFESWHEPIFQIVATDFRFVDPESKAASTCE